MSHGRSCGKRTAYRWVIAMWLVWFALVFFILRYFEIDPVGRVSWWWVALPFAAAFVWFEFIEKNLGLEKKKAMDEMEAAKKARIKRALETDHSARRPK